MSTLSQAMERITSETHKPRVNTHTYIQSKKTSSQSQSLPLIP